MSEEKTAGPEMVVVPEFSAPRVMIHHHEFHSQQATMACELVARWGAVAATTDGEDSAGRQKGRLQTPEELVQRACDCARLLYEELRKRGWMVKAPTWNEVLEEQAAQRKKERTAV